MFYLALAVLCAAGTTLVLKATANRGLSIPTLNLFYRLGMGCAAILGLFLSIPLQEVPALFRITWCFILPGILLLYLAGITAMNAVSTGHVGITAVVIRSSVVLPVGFSLALVYLTDTNHFFRILPWACFGCLCILLALGCFVVEQRGADAITVKKAWIAWLGASFFAHGGWDIVVIGSAGLSARETLFCYYVTSLGAALLSTVKAKVKIAGRQWPLLLWGVFAGILALVVSLVRPLAVSDLGGLIVMPAFAIGSMLLVQFGGSLFWKHRIGWIGWIGVVLASLGILVLVIHTK